jgi:hypothetical protein
MDPASASPQILLPKAQMPPTIAIIPSMINGAKMTLSHPIPKIPPKTPTPPANSTPMITPRAPAMMANMPATVGFHVFSIFYPSLSILEYDIAKTFSCQYPEI